MHGLARGAIAIALLLGSGYAHALRIETIYVPAGESIPSVGEAAAAPDTATGGGDLAAVVRAAADVWESLIPDEHTLTLHFGWYPTTGFSNAGFHQGVGAVGWPPRETSGSLAFNSDAGNKLPMFLDSTPTADEEFTFQRRRFEDLGAGPLEVAREFTASTPAAAGAIDVYTTALHEIGHALGPSAWSSYREETVDGDIDLRSGPFAGASLPVDATHLDLDGALLASSRMSGQRRAVTQADLAAVCQLSGYEGCRLELAAPDFAGDFNGDGLVDAADYTVLRDSHASTQAASHKAKGLAMADAPPYASWRDYYGGTLQTPATFDGDYNGDGRVDAADYTLWRDGLATTDLRADGDGDGRLTAADRATWSDAYGDRPGATLGAVPEPATATLATLAAATLAWRRR